MATRRRAPQKLIKIGITPPGLARGTPAFKNDQRMLMRDTRPPPEKLARLPWLSQSKAYQVGYHLMTHGLQKHAHHLELEMCNVPGPFVNAAASTLNHLAGYLLNSSARFEHGEVMSIGNERDEVVGFRKIEPGSDKLAPHEAVLRVVFLC